jgi:hypothetical protein
MAKHIGAIDRSFDGLGVEEVGRLLENSNIVLNLTY